jgi:glutamate dehydrogenase/leucine dehydrogenase
MAVNLAQLKSELQSDPRSYGYAALISAQNWNGVAAALNLIRTGANGGPAITVRRTDISPQEVLEAIDARDFISNANNLAASYFESVTQSATIRLLDDAGADTRLLANLKRAVNNTNQSQDRLQALAVRQGSRAEELFGRGERISDSQVEDALRLA